MPAYLTDSDGSNQRPVKNLGWLLRHWQDVERFDVTTPGAIFQLFTPDGVVPVVPTREVHVCGPDALLVARLKNGGTYATHFASCNVLLSWLDRPVFRGLPLNWYGAETKCGEYR